MTPTRAEKAAERVRDTLLQGQRDEYLRACRDLWRAAHPVTLPAPMPERDAAEYVRVS